MAEIRCQFVRPDRLMYEGPVASLVLATLTGEMGIWPGHAPAICALGDGVVRLNMREEDGGGIQRVIISGGYAEIIDDTVIILADHARAEDDVEDKAVYDMLDEAEQMLSTLAEDDHRRAYWENRIKWCNLLLKYAARS